MKPYIFIFKVPDKNGKFIFTEDELKEVLEKVYNDAYAEGLKAGQSWWNSPTITYTGTTYPYYTPNTTGTPAPEPNKYTITCNNTETCTGGETSNAIGD